MVSAFSSNHSKLPQRFAKCQYFFAQLPVIQRSCLNPEQKAIQVFSAPVSIENRRKLSNPKVFDCVFFSWVCRVSAHQTTLECALIHDGANKDKAPLFDITWQSPFTHDQIRISSRTEMQMLPHIFFWNPSKTCILSVQHSFRCVLALSPGKLPPLGKLFGGRGIWAAPRSPFLPEVFTSFS